ncbi:hypothetical protein NPX13_g5306 [Xylaria arbuscula]|uniref:BZIP domain-containing protein n=1 Tax=Xylaria arbuscula TaxID=114810 RepID=A0A9W8NEV1_9PEZI|nr:hypothetical protein NPX13_g5306 [Xylaria arbuscula]
METSSNSPPVSEAQPRKRRGRNSDVRKEQNRIASRAYREKRRQKLALLDEILKSDSHPDSMSSVSDETESPVPEFRTMESTRQNRNSSHSPAPYYMPAVPVMSSVPPSVQPLPSNGPSHDTDAYLRYSVKDYVQEAERFATHAHDPNTPPIGMSTGYVSSLPPISPMPATPMFPFDEDFMGDPFSTYPLLESHNRHQLPEHEFELRLEYDPCTAESFAPRR